LTLKLYGEGCHRVVVFYALSTSCVRNPYARYGILRNERRTKDYYSMATQPNLDSTLIWRKSRLSGESGQCVEVAKSESSVLVRDSGDQSGAVLELTSAQWLGLLRRIKNDEAGLG
jgi:hypothetical protein